MTQKVYGGEGDFTQDAPDFIGTTADQAGAEFLLCLDGIEPKILNQLKEEILPALPRTFSEFRNRELSFLLAQDVSESWLAPSLSDTAMSRLREAGLSPIQTEPMHPDDESRYWELKSELEEQVQAIADWALHWRLTARKLCQIVVETLADWVSGESGVAEQGNRWGIWIDHLADSTGDSETHSLTVRRSGSGPTLDSREDFEFRLARAWDPFQEPWGTAESRLSLAFQSRLKEFRNDVETLAVVQGSRVQRKRSKSDHFRWLALYQVQDKSFGSVAKEFHASREAVMQAIKSVAALIGLQLRKPKPPGRSKGTTGTRPRHRARK